ncbi:MAG: hypothetical protein HDS11_02790 [Bacteroides sp.]|nr:hypothetical protein [Bacteroides sp.]
MKNLTIKKVIEDNFNGLQKFANKSTEIKGENIFFYLPAVLLRIPNAWANLENNNGEFNTFVPLNTNVIAPKYADFEGKVSIAFKVIDSNQKVLSSAIYENIPLGTPLYNQGYLIPKATYKRGHYFGFTAKFPVINNDATIKINEKWDLNSRSCDQNFAFERNLKIPLQANKNIKSHEFIVNNDYNHYFSHNISFTDKEHSPRIQLIFDPFRNYNFNDLNKDKSYQTFGKQSIIFGHYPYIESLFIEDDGIQPLHMQFMNSQPYFKAKGMIDFEQEQKQTVDLLLKRFNGELDQYKELLNNAEEMSYWFKARFNLFEMPGRHFITVFDDKELKSLELIYPTFSVSKN